MKMQSFEASSEVDFVIVGSGAAGGVIAKELSTAGFKVVVLEQGPWRESGDFRHDEVSNSMFHELTLDPAEHPQSVRRTESEKAEPVIGRTVLTYSPQVGGSSVHFSANFWRLRPIDFIERSVWGPLEGTGFADWPITYAELEPYYTKVEWEIGVSGSPGPNDPPRSRPFPMPPTPVKSSGVLLDVAAKKLGWSSQPAPLAILSQPYDGRPPCMHCGFCFGYGCEFGAKSSTLVSMIPKAVATGNCEVRPRSRVHRIETNAQGRVTGVVYRDGEGMERRQRAKAVVLSANGAETPRLLFLSESPLFPQGLANSSGKVGKYIMHNGSGGASGLFEHPANEYKSVVATRIMMEFYDADPKRGFYGGGGIDARNNALPLRFALNGLPPGSPTWGAEYKNLLRQQFAHRVTFSGHTTSIPMESNNVTLDPDLRDPWGRPGLRLTYSDHPDDMKVKEFFRDRAVELMEAAGAKEVYPGTINPGGGGVHLLGTARMGNDPTTSVVDKFHRAHDVPNLFICDGSSLVSSTRGQPTMTIQALAFRAGHHIAEFARRNEI